MIVTRFAPSPTGYLHLGHARSALIAERAAREAGGRFLLRIEDIDTARSRPEFETAIIEDLAWLGVRLDPSANAANASRIGGPESRIDVRVIATDEEAMIAQHTLTVVNQGPAAPSLPDAQAA